MLAIKYSNSSSNTKLLRQKIYKNIGAFKIEFPYNKNLLLIQLDKRTVNPYILPRYKTKKFS